MIFSINYSMSFFRKFDLILNALDNRIDRDLLNMMCSMSNVHHIDCYQCASECLINSKFIPAEVRDAIDAATQSYQ